MQHGPFALPTTQYLKPHQVRQFLNGACCLTSLSSLTVQKLGNTDRNKKITTRTGKTVLVWDNQPGDKVLLHKDSILRKTESPYESDPWTIMSVHANGTIRIQHGTKSEILNIRRVTPYFE
jgi:hypothetical protein